MQIRLVYFSVIHHPNHFNDENVVESLVLDPSHFVND